MIRLPFLFSGCANGSRIRSAIPILWSLVLLGAAAQEQVEIPENETQLDPSSWLLPIPEGISDGLPNGLLYERWNEVKGETVADLLAAPAFRGEPTVTGIVASPDFPHGDGIDFGIRLRGFLVAPVSGTVRFAISSDDNSELWLSANDNPLGRKKVAWLSGPAWYGSTPPGFTGRTPSQWSAPVQLEAGRSYYLEAYHKEAGGEDHFELMWQTEGSAVPAVIPQDVLRPWSGTAQDADDDGLPDVWQAEKRLAGRADAGWWQDSDGDGITNLEEFNAATDPLDASPVRGSALLEIWYGIDGHDVADLRRDPRFRKPPHRAFLVQGTATATFQTGHFGSRLSGFLVPTESGRYELALASDDSAELWLSPDSSRFTKQRVAYNDSWRGEAADGEWKSAPSKARSNVELEAGRSYYFEILHKDHVEPGWVGLGWRKEGEETFRSVMPEFVQSPGKSDSDANRDGMPDPWAAGISSRAGDTPVDLGEFDDPDGDGIVNLLEYQAGSDPLQRTLTAGAFARQWWFHVPGISLENARKSGIFLKPPSMFTLTEGAASEVNAAEQFASRLRGSVKAPVTGEYRFWISGDNQCELWLSDSGRKFHKRKIASVMPLEGQNPETDIYTNSENWDTFPRQTSELIELEAGEERFVEILHKEGSGRDHVEIAWQFREQGGEWSERTVVNAEALTSFAGDDDDLDDDYLPDSWEVQYGLDPEDNGLKNRKRQGEYGDFDADLLTNHEELMLGTNPALADTDGDGMRDNDEVRLYESDPKVKDASPPVKYADINLRRFSGATGTWFASADGTLFSTSRRGAANFNFDIGEAGIYLIELQAVANTPGNYAPPVPVVISVDGTAVGRGEVQTEDTILRWFTPWLPAGSHTLTVDNRNVRVGVSLEIKALSLYRHPGEDLDGNGIADWMQKAILKQNGFDSLTAVSSVSPLCLEGKARLAGITRVVHPGGELAVSEGLEGGWYANIPLDPAADTPVTIAYEGGAFRAEKSLAWTTTNLLEAPDVLRVRKGDSLKVNAVPTATDGSATTARISLDNGIVGQGTGDQIHVVTFPEAGTFTLSAATVSGTEALEASITVEVVEADFGPAFSLATGADRVWRIGGVPHGVVLDADPQFELRESSLRPPAARAVIARYTGEGAATPRVLARLWEDGPVISTTTVNVFRIAGAGVTRDTRLIDVLPDGTRVLEFMIMIDGVIPADLSIWLELNVADAVFADGSTRYHLTAADFDENGIARILVYKVPGTGIAKICHWIRPYEDDEPLPPDAEEEAAPEGE